MQEYKSFWISGRTIPGPPYTTYWNLGGAVLYKRDNGSIVELAQFTLNSFEFDDQDVAEFFGMALARLVVDTSHHELLTKRRGR
jgi:hypothetical protein